MVQQLRPYWCWATQGDSISLYTSSDRVTWTLYGTVFSALPGTWEDDGNAVAGGLSPTPTGISNFVVSRLRSGQLVAAYTAGRSPASASSGGIGLAYSDDGIHWVRYSQNPILTTNNAFAYVDRLLRLPDRLWLYVHDDAGEVGRVPIADPEGTPYGSLVPLPGLVGTAMLGYDSDGCWSVAGSGWDSSVGFSALTVYRAGDCETYKGDVFSVINASDYGFKGFASVALVETAFEGGLLGGPSLLLAVGNSWGAWTPLRVTLGAQKPVWTPPLFAPAWNRAGFHCGTVAPTTYDWTAEVDEQRGQVVVIAACGADPCSATATRPGAGDLGTMNYTASPGATLPIGPIYPAVYRGRGVPLPSTITILGATMVVGYQIGMDGQWSIVNVARQP